MLVTLLVLSVAFTVACVVLEVRPPKPVAQEPKPTPVMVEMQEDNEFDEDPPTVVMRNRKDSPDVVQLHRIESDPMAILTPSIKMGLLKISQFFSWM